MTNLHLYTKLSSLPDELRKEVSEFIDHLKHKLKKEDPPKKRQAGLAKGKIRMSDDFNEPLNDFRDF